MNIHSYAPHLLTVAAFALASGIAIDTARGKAPSAGADCAASTSTAEPATAPNRASADGTSPGNSGSTGWTGGTGGAYVGTNPQGAVESSTTWQPPTARGLGLAMAAETVDPC